MESGLRAFHDAVAGARWTRDVYAALKAAPDLPIPDPDLTATIDAATRLPRRTARELFTERGDPLACWREEDYDPADDWLNSPKGYPLYESLFRTLLADRPAARLLEIGVRTGYVGVVFARAMQGPALYCGVDPNLYLSNGLELAARAFEQARAFNRQFTYQLIEGSSHDRRVRAKLRAQPPFDVVHIDGDHSPGGKLADLDLCRSVLSPGSFVLVDDYDHVGSVPKAIRRAFALRWYRRYAIAPTIRGLAILTT